ncbi:hypothetical protein [Streptomyces sp. NPDC056291]
MNPVHGGPGWTLSWSNAEHPPLLPRTSDARATPQERDILQHQGF